MFEPIHPPIYIFRKNDINVFYDKIIINCILPPNNLKIPNHWVHWIKNIEGKISLSIKDSETYYEFDKFHFHELLRQTYNLFYQHQLIFKENGFEVFNLFPMEFLEKKLNYIFGLKEATDIDFKIEIAIHFNTPDKIFLSNEALNNSFNVKIDFEETSENDAFYIKHKIIWEKNRKNLDNEFNSGVDLSNILEKMIHC